MACAWSRSAMTSSLGESGLSVFHAGHWLWQRPHSVHVVKSSSPFQVKSHLADAEGRVLVELLDLLEVEHLAADLDRLQLAEACASIGVALEEDVEEGEEGARPPPWSGSARW